MPLTSFRLFAIRACVVGLVDPVESELGYPRSSIQKESRGHGTCHDDDIVHNAIVISGVWYAVGTVIVELTRRWPYKCQQRR